MTAPATPPSSQVAEDGIWPCCEHCGTPNLPNGSGDGHDKPCPHCQVEPATNAPTRPYWRHLVTTPLNVAGRDSADQVPLPVTKSLARGTAGDPAVSVAGVGPNTSPAPQPLIVGLDLSLVATGIAHMTHAGVVTDLVSAEGNGLIRLRRLAYTIRNLCEHADLVCIEGPAYHQGVGAGYHERAGLHWLVLDRLWKTSTPVAIVGPSVLKQYATGRGNSGKDAMILAAARRFPTFDGDNNQADALWLAALGLDHLTGQTVVPASHRTKLASVNWPTVARAS